jgi:hypothetical protein
MTSRSHAPMAPGGQRLRHRIWLRFQGHPDFELNLGVTLVGRGVGCQLVLDDPLISRRHACFVVDDQEVTLKDLGSTNGVLVNGMRVDELRMLVPGDYITIGPFHAELCWVPFSAGERVPAPREMPSRRPAADTVVDKRPPGISTAAGVDSEVTSQGSALEMLSGVAEKALELGRGMEADRMLRRALEALLERVREGAPADATEVARAGLLAVRLARTTGQGQWIDYVFRLFTETRQLLPGSVIDELHIAVRSAPGVSIIEFRRYVEAMRAAQQNFGPAERFLVRRLESLEGVLVS